MGSLPENLLDELRGLEKKINSEIAKKQQKFHYEIEKKKVKFASEQLEEFKKIKKSLFAYLRDTSFLTYLSLPFIYFIFLPTLFFDISLWFYQNICFPIYGIAKVKRSDYIVFDRHQLKFLNYIQRFNCLYCSYVNGFIAYAREVASRTEQYFCPIRHALKVKGLHSRHYKFLAYGEANEFYKKLEALREELKSL